jgi:hypothetical protein
MSESGSTGGTTPGVPGGRSGGNSNRGSNAGRGNGNTRRGYYPRAAAPKQVKFEGACAELKGSIFDCTGYDQADVYVKTKEQLEIYVGANYSHGGTMANAIDKLKAPTVSEPLPPANYGTDQVNAAEKFKWEMQMKEIYRTQEDIKRLVQKLYSLILGQCTDALIARIEAHSKYATASVARDGIELLAVIKSICFNFQDQKYVPQSIYESKKRWYKIEQGRGEPLTQYYERYQNNVEVIEQCGGTVGYEEGVQATVYKDEGVSPTTTDAGEIKSVLDKTKERMLATGFIMGADEARYKSMILEFENSYTMGVDKWPKTLTDAHRVLANWKGIATAGVRIDSQGVSFNTDGTTEDRGGGGGRGPKCWRCFEVGHLKRDCPNPKVAPGTQGGQPAGAAPAAGGGDANTQVSELTSTEDSKELTANQLLTNAASSGEYDAEVHFSFLECGVALNNIGPSNSNIPSDWILLDNQSTVDVFSNEKLLKNIRTVPSSMRIRTQAGEITTNTVGDLHNYGSVWYCEGGIANILSLNNVKRRYKVTFDSENGNEFVVHKPCGGTRTFRQSPRGLYYMSTSDGSGTTLVSTVDENKSKYSASDYSRALLARNLQKKIGRPSLKTFLEIVNGKRLRNNPITRDDVLAAEDIFGPDLGSLKGKTVRKASGRVDVRMVPIPAVIMERYKRVTLAGDIMKVNKIPFMVSISSIIKFGTVELLKDQKMVTVLGTIRHFHGLYAKRGFRVETLLMDGEFEPLRGELSILGITLNTVSRGEHVPEAERRIRTLKERTRSAYNTLPFNKIPAQMAVQMVYSSNFWLNVFPPGDGVSRQHSPRELITGLEIDYNKHCQLEYGAYAQVHEEHDNTMATRTTGAIAMRPTGNSQGGYYFYSLTTGRLLNRNHWTALPMPADVIQRVHDMAKTSSAGVTFTDKYGHEYEGDDGDGDDDDDGDPYIPVVPADPEADEELDRSIAGVDEQELEDLQQDAMPDHDMQQDDLPDPLEVEAVENNDGDPAQEEEAAPVVTDDSSVDDNDDMGSRASTAADETAVADGTVHSPAVLRELRRLSNPVVMAGRTRQQTQDAQVNVTTDAYGDMRDNLMSRRDAGVTCPSDYNSHLTDLEATVMTQMGMKKGIKTFGARAVEAVQKELKQLHDRSVVKPRHVSELTAEQRRAALQYLMFLKEKRNGTVKGRGCADGRKQREGTKKEDASAPTVAIESLMLSCTIDAMERRDVATVDIPGAFMQADMDETVHVKLEGTMAELFSRLDPTLYRKYVRMERGKPVLYVELLKALYGTIRAALLFWRMLSAKLVELGFVINPYDWCVANKMVDGKQCTILWHVDDLKISHVDADVVTDVIKTIDTAFGVETPITINRGKVHDYLGMTLDYTEDGKVSVKMLDYVEGMLEAASVEMRGEAATPAGEHLFVVNEDEEKLNEGDAQDFHHLVAKALFLCKRGRPDIQTAVAFLCTRVKAPDMDDNKKLKRMIQYLRGSRKLVLTLEADNLQVIKWWVDASFAVHPDMRSHTGGVMSLGKGAVYSASTRQKLNTRSSTEAELVGIDDVMAQVLWTRYFLEAQGYPIDDNVVYQDNQSTMLLAKNGRASSSKRTRHINIRYYFVADRIKNGELRVEYCPTGDMVADFYTKPLQGSLFRRLRDMILNIKPDDGPASMEPIQLDHRSVLGMEPTEPSADGRTWAQVATGVTKRATESSSKYARALAGSLLN